MKNIKETLTGYPEISFIENLTLEDLKNEMIRDYEEKYEEETGKEMTLGMADPNRLILYAAALQLYQAFQYIDRAGKQSFLKYSQGAFLDNLGALKGICRLEGNAAKTVIRFSVSEVQEKNITIPMGTRCTAGDTVYWYTREEAIIQPGESFVDVPAECIASGSFANGYGVGKVNTLVDTIAYIGSIANIVPSAGGTDMETDESLANRIYLAPSNYSVAGPEGAYIYWAKTYCPDATDVKVSSPSGGVVDIRLIKNNGEIPSEEDLTDLQEKLQKNNIRPLTDKVEVHAPEIVSYGIDLTYKINESDKTQAAAIQENVNAAVEAYQVWQKEKIGRDINPSKLNAYIIQAGAKRVEITQPVFEKTTETSVAVAERVNVIFGGIEDD